MKKVFADKSLGYDPEEKFDIPEGYDPCASVSVGDGLNGIEEVYE